MLFLHGEPSTTLSSHAQKSTFISSFFSFASDAEDDVVRSSVCSSSLWGSMSISFDSFPSSNSQNKDAISSMSSFAAFPLTDSTCYVDSSNGHGQRAWLSLFNYVYFDYKLHSVITKSVIILVVTEFIPQTYSYWINIICEQPNHGTSINELKLTYDCVASSDCVSELNKDRLVRSY